MYATPGKHVYFSNAVVNLNVIFYQNDSLLAFLLERISQIHFKLLEQLPGDLSQADTQTADFALGS